MKLKETYMVVGADSFIGASLVKGLYSEGYNVIQIGRKENTEQDYYTCLEVQNVINLAIDLNVSKIFHIICQDVDCYKQFTAEEFKVIKETTKIPIVEIITAKTQLQ